MSRFFKQKNLFEQSNKTHYFFICIDIVVDSAQSTLVSEEKTIFTKTSFCDDSMKKNCRNQLTTVNLVFLTEKTHFWFCLKRRQRCKTGFECSLRSF